VTDPPKVAAARIDVERAKGALRDTIGALMKRFQPHNLVEDIWEQAKNKGADLAEDAVDAVAKRPVAVGGAIAALAMFLARDPLKKATVKFYDAMTPLFEPRSKAVALKEKQAAKRKAAPAKRAMPVKRKSPATRTPRRPAAKKTEKL
jgi:hypothetical protein